MAFLTGQDYGSGSPSLMGSQMPGISSMLLSSAGGSNINSARSHFAALIGGSLTTTVENSVTSVIPVPGVITNLRVELSDDIGATSSEILTVTLQVNGSDSSPLLQCVITGGAGTETQCDAGTDTSEVRVKPWDLVSYSFVVAGDPDNGIEISFSAQFDSDFGNTSMLLGNHSTSNTGTTYGALTGENSSDKTTSAQAETMVSLSGRVGPFLAYVDTAPGAGDTRTFELLKDGASFSPVISCSVAETTKQCSMNGSDAVSPGDRLSVKHTLTGTPANTAVHIGLGFTADTNGFMFMVTTDVAKHATGTRYYLVSVDSSAAQATGLNAREITSGPMTVTALYAEFETDPGADADLWAITLMNETSTTALTCSVTGVSPHTCNDTGESVSISADDEISIRFIPADTPTGTTGGTYVGFAARIP